MMARVTVLLAVLVGATVGELSIGVDGGYTEVLVRVEDGVGVEGCRQILQQLSDLLAEASAGLNREVEGRAYFHSFLLEVPEEWEEGRCGYSTDREEVVGGARPDIVVQEGSGEARVEQVVGCGHTAEGLYLGADTLEEMEGEELVGRWMEYRYGVFGWGEEELANQTELSRHQEVCGGRSREEVVREHPDFAGVRTDGEPLRALVPEVRVVRRAPERLVLAVETTQGMLEDDVWRWVNKALQKVVRWDLAPGTEVAVVSFSNSSRVEWQGALGSQEARDLAGDSVPGKYQLEEHGALCVSCMVQAVAGELAGSRGHLVVLTRGGQDSLSLTDEEVIRAVVESTGLRLSTVLLPSNSSGLPLPFYDEVAGLSGGSSVLVRPSTSPMASYVAVVEGLATLLGADQAQVVHAATAARDGGVTTGEFTIDASLGTDTQFGIYVADPEDHMIKAVTLRDGLGREFGPYRKMSSSYDLINLKTPNIGDGPRPFFGGGRWSYMVEWWGGRGEQEEGIVLVTSTPRARGGREVEGWARVGEECGEVTLFARVTRDGRAVAGAKVEAVVEVAGLGGEMAVIALTLGDAGRGEPDLEQGDGVYTGVISSYPMVGRYAVRLVVEEEGEDTARVEVQGPTLHLSTLPCPCPSPSRVADLTVSSYNSTLAATWTSPGGVHTFSLLYSTTLQGLLASSPTSLLDMEVEEGREEEVRVEDIASPLYEQMFYVGLVARDSAGRSSRLSNIVTVWVEGAEVEEQASHHLPILGLPSPSTSEDWFMIVLISSGLGGLLFLSLVAILFFLVTGRRKRKSSDCAEERVESPVSSAKGPPSVSEYQTDSSSCDSDRQVTDLRQVMSHLPRAPGHGPTYWSASQILAKHHGGSIAPASLSSSFDNQGYGWSPAEAPPPRHLLRPDSYRQYGPPPTPPKPEYLRSREEERRSREEGGRCREEERRRSPEDLRLSPEDEGYDSASREVHLIVQAVQARNITEV